MNAVRNHLHVENKLHRKRDLSFDEDRCSLRSVHTAANISLLNKIALNLLKNEKNTKADVKIGAQGLLKLKVPNASVNGKTETLMLQEGRLIFTHMPCLVNT